MATTHLNITQLTEAQNQKYLTVNNALEAIDQAMNGGATVLTITGNTTVTAAQLRAGVIIQLNGTPGAGFNLDIPNVRRIFLVRNSTGQTATVRGNGGAGASFTVVTGKTRWVVSTGADVFDPIA